jgi:hypothetical protein
MNGRRPPVGVGRLGLALVAALVLALTLAGCWSTPTSAPTTPARPTNGGPGAATRATVPAVDTAATPRGWLKVALGDAQVSVPADWGLVSDGESACLTSPGAVVLGGGSWCPPGVGRSGPPSPMLVTLRRAGPQSVTGDGPPSRVIRGVALYAAGLVPVYAVPSLHAVVGLDGPVPAGVLSSLTYSPRAVVLAAGPRPEVPSSWRWIRFQGIRFAVPRDWAVERVGSPGGCAVPLAVADRVTLATGTPSADSCPPRLPDLVSSQPVAAMEIDHFDQGPATPGAVRQPTCPGSRSVGGVSVCVDATAAGSTLEALVSTRHTTVTVLLGLWGDGVAARTVFDSLTPAR